MAKKEPGVQKFTTVLLPPDQLIEHPRNAKKHPKKQVEALSESLRKFGQTKPVLATRGKMIVAGHGIVKAAIAASIDLVEVKLWDVDDKTALAYLAADNKLAELGEDDDEAIQSILADIESDWHVAMGFGVGKDDEEEGDDAEDDKPKKKSSGDEDIPIEEVATDAVADRFYLSIKGPLTAQSKVLSAFKALEREFPEIQVQMGTVQED